MVMAATLRHKHSLFSIVIVEVEKKKAGEGWAVVSKI